MSQHDSSSADFDEEVVDSFEEEEQLPVEETEAEAEDGDEEDAPKKKRGVILQKPKANVYTVMMILSLVALTIGCLCLYGEWKPYSSDWRARSAK